LYNITTNLVNHFGCYFERLTEGKKIVFLFYGWYDNFQAIIK